LGFAKSRRGSAKSAPCRLDWCGGNLVGSLLRCIVGQVPFKIGKGLLGARIAAIGGLRKQALRLAGIVADAIIALVVEIGEYEHGAGGAGFSGTTQAAQTAGLVLRRHAVQHQA